MAHLHWCCICDAYVKPGTHHLRPVTFGHGPLHPSQPPTVGGPGAVIAVVAVIVGAGFALLAAIALMLRLT